MGKTKKPWLTERGYSIPDSELRILCRSWSQKTWDDYLEYLEKPTLEALIPGESYNSLAETVSISFEQTEDKDLQAFLLKSLEDLTQKQKQVLTDIFWNGLTTREIGARLNISACAVQKIKDRALQTLKKNLEGVNTLHIMKGDEISAPVLKQGGIHEHNVFKLQASKAS